MGAYRLSRRPKPERLEWSCQATPTTRVTKLDELAVQSTSISAAIASGARVLNQRERAWHAVTALHSPRVHAHIRYNYEQRRRLQGIQPHKRSGHADIHGSTTTRKGPRVRPLCRPASRVRRSGRPNPGRRGRYHRHATPYRLFQEPSRQCPEKPQQTGQQLARGLKLCLPPYTLARISTSNATRAILILHLLQTT